MTHEKSFEEEFPELKYRIIYEHLTEEYGDWTECNKKDFEELYPEERTREIFYKADIRDFCLSKQRVKEGIIKVAKEEHAEHLLNDDTYALGKLLKELKGGLNDYSIM